MRWTTHTRILTGAAACSLMTACHQEKTLTIREFMYQPAVLAQTRSACLENPGDGWKRPNCINAERADFFKVVGGAGTCFSDQAVNRPCVDDYLRSVGM